MVRSDSVYTGRTLAQTLGRGMGRGKVEKSAKERSGQMIISIILLGICAIFYVQFLTPTLYGADGYLHIRMAEFLRDMGPRYDFHWARFSIFSGYFSDKDFLFHLILIPFTFFKDIFLGAKLAAAVFASLLFLVYYLIVKRYAHKSLLPFFLTAFFFSDMFLGSISRPRPISLVALATILSIHLLIKKKYRLVFLTAFLYALAHVTSPLIILYAVIVEVMRYADPDRKEFYSRNVVAAFLGVLAGFLIHPNFPNNFLVFYLNAILVPVYTIKTGVLEMGAEFFPLNTREFLLGYPVVIIGLILLIFVSISKRPKARFQTNVFLILSAIFFVLSFICRRYLMQGYIVMLVALASYFSDALAEKSVNKKIIAFLLIGLVILGVNSYKAVRYNAFVSQIVNKHYEQAGSWMKDNIPEKELIFHANWSDSQYFIGLNPKNDYFVTLDPVYMYYRDPGLYGLYRNVAFGRVKDPYVVLKYTFGVKYGYISKNYFSGLVGQVRSDNRFTILQEDNLGVIFRLI